MTVFDLLKFHSLPQQGSTALQLVCLYSPLREKSDKHPTKRRCEVVKLLLDHGADIKLADEVCRNIYQYTTYLVVDFYHYQYSPN